MFAAYIEQFGAPDQIRHGELPAPRPGPADVIVDVEVSAVNHVDTFVRSGAWRTDVRLPFVIGRDLVGTVTSTGSSVVGFSPGDRVWCNSLGYAGRQGAAAEQALVAADRLYHLPEGVAAADAVAVAHPAATAHLALFTHGRLRVGETVVVLGAGGNVGSALVLMAARAGARVVAVAGAGSAERVRALGAAEFVDYRDPDTVERIRRAAPRGVDMYLDTSARNDLTTAVDLLARRGRIVLLAGLDTTPTLPAGRLYVKDCSVVGFAISQASADELADAAAHINLLLADGSLRPSAVHEMPLSEAAAAHRLLDEGKARGKIVLRTGA
ncbi:NADPH:quinone reductase [Streptomyces luteolus]|uniref:NADPH:quinone reductase n=1 Tax=Streptomyces luteolus TaxID=3043615 RepID=A0ABT6TA88_9ACTN|nr:NADPH:quinone reductase [Streptomyces sp. B-S-A12]MDI3423939.1 NADPH:quinone reductase [Streptomyces sp. B-S-A12]